MKNKYMKTFTVFILGLCFSICLNAQEPKSKPDIHIQIQKKTKNIYDSLVQIRRDFHQHPEVSGEEKETAKKIATYLANLGLEVKTNIGGYGVVGILKGKQPGPVIVWRADIDAFKDNSPDVVDFPSKNIGVRHICGHDVHITIGLGIATVLNSIKNEFSGTVLFIFQPAEEIYPGGAQKMLDDNVFQEIKPEAIFALHVAPMPTGFIAVKEKEMYSKLKVLKLELRNNSELDTMVNECINKIKGLSTLPEDSKFYNMETLGDPELGLSSPKSIYANYFVVHKDIGIEKTNSITAITARFQSSNIENHQTAISRLINELQNSKWKDYVKSISFIYDHPTVYNDPQITMRSINIIKTVYGAQAVFPLYGVVPMRNDDFARFQEQVPGVYFFLGASDFTRGLISMPHSPNFAVDEKAIEIGANYFSSLLYEYMNEK
jgi:metal-dependent amidase/aminoacylase/carboxypeptidase family protein